MEEAVSVIVPVVLTIMVLRVLDVNSALPEWLANDAEPKVPDMVGVARKGTLPMEVAAEFEGSLTPPSPIGTINWVVQF